MDPVAPPLAPSPSRSFVKINLPPSIIASAVHPPPFIFNDHASSQPSICNYQHPSLPSDEADRLGLRRTNAIPSLYKKQTSPASRIASSLLKLPPPSSSSLAATLQESSGVYPGWRTPVSSIASPSPIPVAELKEKLGEEADNINSEDWAKIPSALHPDQQVKFNFSTIYSRIGLLPYDPEIVEFEPGFGPL